MNFLSQQSPREGQEVTEEPENLGKASGLMARRHVEKKECDRRDYDERSLPGDQVERVYEPVSLVASACKAAWFPLCLEAGVTEGEECPCHTVGACGCFSGGQAVNHRVSPLQSSAPHSCPHPQHAQTGRDKAFLGSVRANPPDLGLGFSAVTWREHMTTSPPSSEEKRRESALQTAKCCSSVRYQYTGCYSVSPRTPKAWWGAGSGKGED